MAMVSVDGKDSITTITEAEKMDGLMVHTLYKTFGTYVRQKLRAQVALSMLRSGADIPPVTICVEETDSWTSRAIISAIAGYQEVEMIAFDDNSKSIVFEVSK